MRNLPTIALSLASVSVALPTCSRSTSPQPVSSVPARAYPHEHEPIGSPRQIYSGALAPRLAVNTLRNGHRLFPTRTIPRSKAPFPLRPAKTPLGPVRIRKSLKVYGLQD